MTIDIDKLTPEEEDAILRAATAQLGGTAFFSSFEELVESSDGFGLPITPLQRAICRIIEGRHLMELRKNKVVIEALGGNSRIPRQSKEIVLLAGIRTAKSMLAAATAIWASQTADLSQLREGEIARYSILSLELDNARIVLGHLVGALQKPRLSALRVQAKQEAILDEIGADSVGSEYLRHPSGRIVEIRVVAGKRAGGSLVGRWSMGVCFDEAPRMLGAGDGVINYEDARKAVVLRILNGARILSIGSPWQPYGPIYDIVQKEWGHPQNNRIVIRGKAYDMNPVWWDKARVEEARLNDPKTYQTDVLAEFADEEEALFPQALLAKSTLRGLYPVPFSATHDYVAAMDPATRGNAWTLVIAGRRGRKKTVVYHREWRGTSLTPLNPRDVLKEAAEDLANYKLNWCYTDQWAADANKAVAQQMNLHLVDIDWTQQENVEAYSSLAAAMAMGTVEVPNDSQLHKDLKLVQKKPSTAKNGFSIHLQSTPDGRHCDYAPALARAMKQWIDEEKAVVPRHGEPGWDEHWEKSQIEQEEMALIREQLKGSEFEEEPLDDPFDEYLEQQSLVTYVRKEWG